MILKYKGYRGQISSLDTQNGVLHGTVLGIQDVVTFEGKSVHEFIQAFNDSVDEYLAFCAEMGREPEKPPSGRLLVRMPPGLHAQLSYKAKLRGVSLNRLVVDCLARKLAGKGKAVKRRKLARKAVTRRKVVD